MEKKPKPKKRKTDMEYAAEIQRALKPLCYEVVCYERRYSEPIIIKLERTKDFWQ